MLRHLCLSLTITAMLGAGEAAPPAVILNLPDLVRTAERLAAGPYGRIWQQPAVQKLRAELAVLPGADPAWMALPGRVREARFTLTMPTPGPEAEPAPCLALRLPAGQDPAAPSGAVARREGDWWMLGKEGGALALPAAVKTAEADLSLSIDPAAFAAAMPAASVATYGKVLAILGLGRIDIRAEAFPGGVREEALIAGCKLPLRQVDAAALAGFPDKPLAMAAVGIDGAALRALVHAIAEQTGGAADLQRGDAAMQAAIGLKLDDLLTGLDGSVVFASTPGIPFPGMTLSVPARTATDALVTALCERLQPGSGAKLVAEARTQAVLLPLPPNVPLPVSLRRSATRWILSTDQLLIEALAVDAPAPFPLATLWPQADGAVGLAWGDTRVQVQTLVGVLPMGMAAIREPEAKKWASLVQGVLVAALPHLPPSVLVMRSTTDGLRFDGQNGLVADVGPMAILAGMALPAISMVRDSARRANAGSNMRQIAMTMISYGVDNDGRWPESLEATKTYAEGDLVDKVFQSPGHPEIEHPFLYVRPVADAKSTQPVLIQDPACNRGKGSMVCYADGHVAYVKGATALAMWAEAKRLAVLPKATLKDGGIEGSDWTTTGDPAPADAAPGEPAPAEATPTTPALF